jgi:hypothetical protein
MTDRDDVSHRLDRADVLELFGSRASDRGSVTFSERTFAWPAGWVRSAWVSGGCRPRSIVGVHVVGMLGTQLFWGANPRAPIGG